MNGSEAVPEFPGVVERAAEVIAQHQRVTSQSGNPCWCLRWPDHVNHYGQGWNEHVAAALADAGLLATQRDGWPCDDYKAPLTCYTVPNGPKHLTCGGCREAFPNGPEVQSLYRATQRDGLRAAVEALADKWTCPVPHVDEYRRWCHGCDKAAQLRAALAASDRAQDTAR